MTKRDSNGEFKIEHGIPRPIIMRNIQYPFQAMKIGDSFVVPRTRVVNDLYLVAKNRGIKISIRKLENGDRRVWRIA